MPYFIKKSDSGWNTIKDDGTVIGEHKTKAEAVAQMVAVSLAENIKPGGEMRAVEPGSYDPPKGVADAAKRAIRWIDAGLAGQGFTAVGRRRASQLASGEPVSADVVNRMLSYFARHEVDKQATGFNAGEDGFPSAGRVAWDAWGGDAGQSWVNSLDSRVANRDAGELIGLCDIDDTLIVNGELNAEVYAWLESKEADLYLVTGRDASNRADTVAELARLGVEYSELYMNPGADSNDFKKTVAEQLIAEGYVVAFAVDNNPDARSAYEQAGVVDVYDPANLPAAPVMEENSVRTLASELAEVMQSIADAQTRLNDWFVSARSVLEVETPEQAESRFADPATVQENRTKGKKMIEQRMSVGSIELREEGDGMTFRGYASVFNAPSQPLPFTEIVKPGAFKRSLQARNDIKLLWNHDTGQVLGSTRAGTLTLREDSHGLFVEATLPNTTLGRDARELIKRGDVNAMSFGFSVPQGGDSWSEDGQTRELNSVRLYEISIVAYPAYQQTAGTTSVRSDDAVEFKADSSVLRKRLELINKK